MKTRILATLLLLVLLLPASVLAESAGVVLAVRGEVSAERDGEIRALARRAELYVGDRVRTGADSRAQIRLHDNEIIALRPDTELVIEAFDYAGGSVAAEDDQSRKSLIKGGMRAITGVIGAERNTVATPAASLGIRGTQYEAAVTEGNVVYVAVWQGGIYLQNDFGRIELGRDRDFTIARAAPGQQPEGLLQGPRDVLDVQADLSPAEEGRLAEATLQRGRLPAPRHEVGVLRHGDPETLRQDDLPEAESGGHGFAYPEGRIGAAAWNRSPGGGYVSGSETLSEDDHAFSSGEGLARVAARRSNAMARSFDTAAPPANTDWGYWDTGSGANALYEASGDGMSIWDTVYWVSGDAFDFTSSSLAGNHSFEVTSSVAGNHFGPNYAASTAGHFTVDFDNATIRLEDFVVNYGGIEWAVNATDAQLADFFGGTGVEGEIWMSGEFAEGFDGTLGGFLADSNGDAVLGGAFQFISESDGIQGAFWAERTIAP